MQKRLFWMTVVLTGMAAAQTAPAPEHDLTGVWRWTGRSVLTVGPETPAFTPLGKQMFDSYKPSYGTRAIPPALGNDPQGKCDPLGIPRLLFYGGTNTQEFVQTKDRVVEFFEWMHVYRTIWTDGRKPPADLEPSRMGYSTGKWDGDTFVVDTVGFIDNTWVDHFGDPHTDEMTLQERYRRVDQSNMELTVTLTDPKIYTKPWVGDKKTFRLEPKTVLAENFCVPSEEELFNKRMRDPAGGKK